jgi:RecB family exonuclease
MKITNSMNLPAGLCKAVSTERHNAEGCLSATTLIQGVKQIILMDRHWDDLTDDVSDRIWAIWGTAVHSLLEQEGETDFTEQEMDYKVGNITVTGRIDNYDMANGVICDYKTASTYKVKAADYEDWYTQGMIYAWLLVKNGFKATKCRFIAMLKDHSKSEAERDYNYPKRPVYVYEFNVTPERLANIEQYIYKKVWEYESQKALPDDAIPECQPNERWEKPPTCAVRKEGRKTAVRVLDDESEAGAMAADLGKDHYVEYRPGESIRCQSYCLCHEFCNYYRNNHKSNEVKPAVVPAALYPRQTDADRGLKKAA